MNKNNEKDATQKSEIKATMAFTQSLPAILEISSNLKIHIMKTKDFVLRFLITFGIGLIASILVTLCWNYFIKGNGLIVDWETSFRTALILAIVLPLTQIKNK